MGCHPTRVPLVPWSEIEASDLCEANSGHIEYCRDTQRNGAAERHLGMHVLGTYDHSLSLGVIAMRCSRHGAKLIPLSLAIADTPIYCSDVED